MTAKGRWGQKRASPQPGMGGVEQGRGEEGKRRGREEERLVMSYPRPCYDRSLRLPPPLPRGALWQPPHICKATEEG